MLLAFLKMRKQTQRGQVAGLRVLSYLSVRLGFDFNFLYSMGTNTSIHIGLDLPLGKNVVGTIVTPSGNVGAPIRLSVF